jgi:gamma-glutamyl:cysteine ligase YbdK (ATP-grasp superfamily)
MGLDIDREEFDDADRERFRRKLGCALTALDTLLHRPGFGDGPPSIGAELEVSLVDDRGAPLPMNRAVLAKTLDPQVTLELDRFNLEINTRPVALAGRPFTALAADLAHGLGVIRDAAAAHGGHVVTIGILPTLGPGDLTSAALSDSRRYRALSAGLRALRHEPFDVRIDGVEQLAVAYDDVTLQGANTSLQLHLRVPPAAFAATFNAAQIATAPALAAATNSPIFLGRRLWEETRIALFRQSVDDRAGSTTDDWRPARVSFGHGWVRNGALELFAESVALHPPLLPVLGPEDPVACAQRGDVPTLDELRLHHGTVWHWNRAVYDAAGGGHLRVELRALPAGPTVVDMMANAAFLLGTTLGLASDAERLLHGLTFGHARRNFYAAARHGLDAELLWPSERGPSPQPAPAAAVIERLLPVAERGLREGGVAAPETERLLDLIANRVHARTTGARWQQRTLAALESRGSRTEAAAAMLAAYRRQAATNVPVHRWDDGA